MFFGKKSKQKVEDNHNDIMFIFKTLRDLAYEAMVNRKKINEVVEVLNTKQVEVIANLIATNTRLESKIDLLEGRIKKLEDGNGKKKNQ